MLTEKQIRRGATRLTRQLEKAIRAYTDIYNEITSTFVSSNFAAEITFEHPRILPTNF